MQPVKHMKRSDTLIRIRMELAMRIEYLRPAFEEYARLVAAAIELERIGLEDGTHSDNHTE